MTFTTFAEFGLAEPLARAIKDCAYTVPTPIQSAALPPQLASRDILALAETGSGKTAAFLLPILQNQAIEPQNPGPREALALVLAPTRELALQIDAEVAKLARHLPVRRAVVLGGVSKGPQIHALKRGVHILVATPGRLLDLAGERHVDLSRVKTLVLDEADRMFDMGFIRDIRRIVSLLARERRNALFSATMPNEVRALANDLLKDAARIDLSTKKIVVDRVVQSVMFVRGCEKQSRLHTILEDQSCSRVIVFTRTKRAADRVASRLAMAGIGASAIHGNKAQNARQRALSDFSTGRVRVLVATDIAARGIDVADISHVVNFDMPIEAETYVHRIGRTARNGASGVAISLCDPAERPEVAAIERLIKQRLEVVADVGGDTSTPATAAEPPRSHAAHARPHAKAGHRNSAQGAKRQNAGRSERRDRDGIDVTRDRPERGHTPHSGRPQGAPRNGSQAAPRNGSPAGPRNGKPAGPRTGKPAAKGGQGAGYDSRAGEPRSHRQKSTKSHSAASAPTASGSWNGQYPPEFLRQQDTQGRRQPGRRS